MMSPAQNEQMILALAAIGAANYATKEYAELDIFEMVENPDYQRVLRAAIGAAGIYLLIQMIKK